MPRSARSNSSSADVSPSSCKACRELDDSRMVQCDTCDDWYHFDCVGVSQDVENHDWLCPDCIAKQPAKNNQLTNPVTTTVPPVSTSVTPTTSQQCIKPVLMVSTSSDLIMSSSVTTSMTHSPTTSILTLGQNMPMPSYSQIPHSFMPHHSF